MNSVNDNNDTSLHRSKRDGTTYNRPVQRVLANNVAIQVAAAVQPVLIDLLPQLTTLFNQLIKVILHDVLMLTSFHLNSFNKRKSQNKGKSESKSEMANT